MASAERTGLIRDLGSWVIHTACRQLRSWKASASAVNCLCVNVASAEFIDPSYRETVEEVCKENGIEPGALCLEITESVLIDDAPAAVAAFDGLKRLGVQLALDDFGTGYSSLNYLNRFPVDIVKLDQSFVSGINTQPRGAAILTAVVTLAHQIGMTVVAEGVEQVPPADRRHRPRLRHGPGLSARAPYASRRRPGAPGNEPPLEQPDSPWEISTRGRSLVVPSSGRLRAVVHGRPSGEIARWRVSPAR